MAKDVNTTSVEEVNETAAAPEKKSSEKKAKPAVKKENFFTRIWKKLVKLCKDTVGEMKKVVWTPKNEVSKNTKLVLVTVVAVGIAIAVVDTAFSYLINTIAGLIG